MTGQATALGTGLSVGELRNQLQNSTEADMRRRRAIILTSIVGMTSMGLVSLLQTGVVRHLPDAPLDSFDSDKVNSSDTAYALGAPDGTLSFAALALNLPLAAFGGVARSKQAPYAPLVAAAKSGIEA